MHIAQEDVSIGMKWLLGPKATSLLSQCWILGYFRSDLDFQMTRVDDQKAKSSHVNHSRILEHELGCAGHSFRVSRCVIWAPRLIFGSPGKRAHAHEIWSFPPKLMCEVDAVMPIWHWEVTTILSRSRNNFQFFKRGLPSRIMMPFVSHQGISNIYQTAGRD